MPVRLDFCTSCCCHHPSGWKGSMPHNADDEKNDASYFLVPSSEKNERSSPFSSYEEKWEEGSFFYVAVRQRIVLCHTSTKDAVLCRRRKSELVLFFFVGEELHPLFFFLNAEEITLSAAYPKKKGDEPCFIFFVNRWRRGRSKSIHRSPPPDDVSWQTMIYHQQFQCAARTISTTATLNSFRCMKQTKTILRRYNEEVEGRGNNCLSTLKLVDLVRTSQLRAIFLFLND